MTNTVQKELVVLDSSVSIKDFMKDIIATKVNLYVR